MPVSTEQRVIVFAPLGGEMAVIAQMLAGAGIQCLDATSMRDVTIALEEGAGAVLLTEEALTEAGITELVDALSKQASWSDLPILLLFDAKDALPRESAAYLASLTAERSVTVLLRPIPTVTLLTAVQTAARARRRQYEVRDLLASERRAREHAEAAMQIKDEFLATVSHELRTPLSAILIWSKLLESGRASGAQATQAIHAIRTSAEAQSRLIEDLLDVSRMLMGKLRIEVQSRHLIEIIHAAIDVVRPMADAKGVRLDVELAADDDRVLVDTDRIQQVFWNLLSNSVKFTPAGGVVAIQLASKREHLVTTVRDSGEGIATDVLPYMFERFRQGVPGTQRQGGLGLGLPIVKQLIELHGGTIQAESAGPGKGATFTVWLPRAGS